MLKRFLTGIVIMIITVGCFALKEVSPYFFDAYVGVIAIMSTFEVSRVLNRAGRKNDLEVVLLYPVLCYATLILCVTFKLDLYLYFIILVALMAFLFLVSFVINLFQKNLNNKYMVELNYEGSYKSFVVKKCFNNIFVLFYPAFILSLLFLINHITGFDYFSTQGEVSLSMLLLVMIFSTTIVTDTGAYLIGSAIKGRKLCPKISPNKTISGAFGGLLCSITVSLLLFSIFNNIDSFCSLFSLYNVTIWHFLLYGVLASIFSQFGDIYASLVKRKADVKDYGTIFPGHGGFMDRVDGISFNTFFTFIFALFLFL